MILSLFDRLNHRLLLRAGFESRWIDTSAGPVHTYEARGPADLPPLLVQHGISGNAREFREVLIHLLPHVGRVVAPDLPGHGFSAVPDGGLDQDSLTNGHLEALDELLPEPALLFGNSLGGLAVIRYAVARPERARALALCSPGGAPMPEAEFQEFLDVLRMPRHADARAFVDRIHVRRPWYRALVAPEIRRRFHGLHDFMDRIRTGDLLHPDELAALPETVVWWGRCDHLMPASNREFFRTHLPEHAQLEEPDEFGHCPHLDRPRLLADHILRFSRGYS